MNKFKHFFVCSMLIGFSVALSGCSWTTKQLGQNDYEISGYFDFTMKGSVVAEGLEEQARLYCKQIDPNYVPDIYYVSDMNRIFDYQAQRASAKIQFHCVPEKAK